MEESSSTSNTPRESYRPRFRGKSVAPKKPEPRITKDTAFSMVLIATIYDLISLIPLVNIASKILAYLHFWVWFSIKGVSYTKNPKIMKWQAIGAIIGLIPIVSALPEQIITTMRTIAISRLEDSSSLPKIAPATNKLGGKKV